MPCRAGLHQEKRQKQQGTPVSGQAAVATFRKANVLVVAFGIYYPDNREPVIKDTDTEGDMTKVPSGMALLGRDYCQ